MGRRLALLLICMVVAITVGAASAAVAAECAACGKSIKGDAFHTQGRVYHPNCFVCAVCDRPITGSYSEQKGKVYHNDCFLERVALKCSLCDAVLRGEYLQDFWGNSYCKRHEGDAPLCDSCGRFISNKLTGGGTRYDDGRFICNICKPESMTDIDEILEVVFEVAQHMKTFGMEVDYNGVQIHLVGRDKMQTLSGHHSNGLRGFTDYREDWRVFGKSQNRKMHVYLLYGMPRIEIISTVAHELAHVWQFNRGRFQNEREWAEGSCNYAAYLVLGKYPGRESSFFRTSLTRDADPTYGEGFRRVKTLAEAEGTRAWLRYLNKSDDFPKGY
ncbi:MAG TPA: LIM domain-containing protein [Candidatus Krumholzibacteria bacterium]|nr:LIM domain-containing protein [Candidatus Krumholzibacteria bacterium]